MLDELLEKIKKINYQDRLKLLNDKTIVSKLFLVDQKSNPWDFLKVLEVYKAKDLIQVLDNKIIEQIEINYKDQEFIFLENLKLNDRNAFEKALKNNFHLKELLLLKSDLYINSDFSYEMVLELINYIDNKNIDYNKTCLFNIMLYSLKDKSLQEKFLNEKINNFYKIKMFNIFNKDLVSKYLKENIINLSLEDIYNLLNYSSVELNPILYENKNYFKKYIIGNSIYETRINIERLSNRINIDYFLDLFNKEEDKILSMYNNNTKVIDYKNDNSIVSIILDKEFNINYYKTKEEITKKLLFRIIIDKMFQDSIKNVCLNISEILDFNSNKEMLSKDKLIFYKEIINLFDKDSNYLINFYNKYKDSIEVSDFYDDLSVCKQQSYQMLKNSCLKINDIEYLKNYKLSNIYKLDIYKLNGEPFKMLVSCRSTIPSGNSRSPRNCYSLIGNNNLKVFNERGIIYGFTDFDINNIMHVYEDDSYSENNSFKSTNIVNRIQTPDIILSSNMMNEIQIKNEKIGNDEYKRLLPNYLVCFDEVNDRSIKASRILDIPIVIINRKKYIEHLNKNILSNYQEEYTNSINNETNYQDKIL